MRRHKWVKGVAHQGDHDNKPDHFLTRHDTCSFCGASRTVNVTRHGERVVRVLEGYYPGNPYAQMQVPLCLTAAETEMRRAQMWELREGSK